MPLDALGDSTRRRVFESLRHGPRSVTAIAADLPVSRPAVSQHLRVLEQAGLVRADRVGRYRLYAVDRRGVAALRRYVESFWEDVLAAYVDAAAARSHEREHDHG
jgi:DNA-binding transcriptional ArsR family regulator